MKMKIILIAFIVFMVAACKKDNSKAEKPLLQDGPMSAQLGKLIYLGDHGYSRSMPFWGRNSDELFITASSEILRVDLAAKKVEVIEDSGGAVTGKTNENSGVIFIGTITNEHGYYVFNFSSNSIEKIMPVAYNENTLINIAGNNIFYYMSIASVPGPPCNGFCWPAPGPAMPSTFYHLDKQTRQITDLKNKLFMLFLPDGSSAILSGGLAWRMYVFDNTSRTIIDSSDLNNTSRFGLFFHNGVLQSFELDGLGQIIIKNFKTGQVLQQYHTNNLISDAFRVSSDGTKLYYTGGTFNGNSHKLFLYDIASNTEKIIADLPYLQGGGLPFDSFVLSDDNKKIVIRSGNDLYLKVLD
jgi:hypothetical protein